MDRRETWRNRKSRKRRFDDEGPGREDPWRPTPMPGERPGFQSPYRAPPRGAPSIEGGPELGGTVKWYDPGKGFGFVELEDGSGDAFLHVSVVERFAGGVPGAGASIRVRVGRGPKGPQVAEITQLGPAPAQSSAPARRQSYAPAAASGQEVRGTVKWYNAQKGFGFITPEDGGKDVFVHASALGRSGIAELSPGQTVRLQVVPGKKGPEAASVSLG